MRQQAAHLMIECATALRGQGRVVGERALYDQEVLERTFQRDKHGYQVAVKRLHDIKDRELGFTPLLKRSRAICPRKLHARKMCVTTSVEKHRGDIVLPVPHAPTTTEVGDREPEEGGLLATIAHVVPLWNREMTIRETTTSRTLATTGVEATSTPGGGGGGGGYNRPTGPSNSRGGTHTPQPGPSTSGGGYSYDPPQQSNSQYHQTRDRSQDRSAPYPYQDSGNRTNTPSQQNVALNRARSRSPLANVPVIDTIGHYDNNRVGPQSTDPLPPMLPVTITLSLIEM